MPSASTGGVGLIDGVDAGPDRLVRLRRPQRRSNRSACRRGRRAARRPTRTRSPGWRAAEVDVLARRVVAQAGLGRADLGDPGGVQLVLAVSAEAHVLDLLRATAIIVGPADGRCSVQAISLDAAGVTGRGRPGSWEEVSVPTTTATTSAPASRAYGARMDRRGPPRGWSARWRASRSIAAAVRAHRSRGGAGIGRAGFGARGAGPRTRRPCPRSRRSREVLVEPRRSSADRGGRRAVRRARHGHGRAASSSRRGARRGRRGGSSLVSRSWRRAAARPRRVVPTASAWRRLSRARVSSARAATWLTPSAAASSRPVRSWSSARRRAARWRSGMRSRARWRSPERWASITRCSVDGTAPRDFAGPRQEADDLLAADVVESDAVSDLVEPGPGVLGLLERCRSCGRP